MYNHLKHDVCSTQVVIILSILLIIPLGNALAAGTAGFFSLFGNWSDAKELIFERKTAGVMPRNPDYLIGSMLMWTKHGSKAHLVGNMSVIVYFIWLGAVMSKYFHWSACALLFLHGPVIWAIYSSDKVYIIGASGFAFALIGYVFWRMLGQWYLILTSFSIRNLCFKQILISLLALGTSIIVIKLHWTTMVIGLGLDEVIEGVSYESHVIGAALGVIVAGLETWYIKWKYSAQILEKV